MGQCGEWILQNEANVGSVFSRSGQLSEVNLHPDALAYMVLIIVNKHPYKPSLKDIMDNWVQQDVPWQDSLWDGERDEFVVEQ